MTEFPGNGKGRTGNGARPTGKGAVPTGKVSSDPNRPRAT